MFVTFIIQSNISGSICLGTRFLRAISAHARQAPCQDASAVDGRSVIAIPREKDWPNKPRTCSRTCDTNDRGSRSDMQAIPFADDQRTVVSCQMVSLVTSVDVT